MVLLLGLSSFTSFSQVRNDDKNEIVEKRIEYLIESDENSEADYTTVFDQLIYYFDHPLNINTAKIDDLEGLGLLTSIQINDLLKHIEKKGKLIRLEELQSINGFNLEVIRRILPFVKVGESNYDQLSFHDLIKNGDHQYFIRYEKVLEEKLGFSSITDSALLEKPSSRYLGNDIKLYTRYRYKYGNRLSFGFTGEKDAGEQFFEGSQTNGFDYYSAHFFLSDIGKIKQLALGDFQAQFGQGLTYWSGRSFGKSADIVTVKRSATGLKPYTSVDESLFLRGGGMALQFGRISITSFYSYNSIDANVDVSDSIGISDGLLSITSLQKTGFHRTINEIENKDVIKQQQIGGHIDYKTRKLNVGLTGIYSEVNADFNPTIRPFNQFRNSKNKQSKIGVDYNWVYRNFNLFGEFSQSINAGYAFVSGALIVLDPRFSLSVLYRDYQRNFQPIASAGLGENAANENEKGLYLGFIAQPFKKWTCSAYYDQFTFPWLKFGVDAPSKGIQYLAQLSYQPSKKLKIYLRIRGRSRDRNTSSLDQNIDYLVEEKQTNYRFNYNYKISDFFKLKGRVEFVNYTFGESFSESGHLIYQDLVFSSKKSPLSFSFRYGIFDTESFNSRIYAYENDVLNSFSIPAYFNRGTRTYLTIHYKINRFVDVWLRYGLTYYDNLDVISSGLEEIQGNHKQEVKAQIRLKF